MAGQPYNYIFKELVKDSDDIVGLVAYGLYKKQKIAFVSQTEAKGAPATPQELGTFHTTSMLEPTLKGYREQAEKQVSEFLNKILSDRVDAIEDQTRSSVLFKEITHVKNHLEAKRTWIGLFKDIGANLTVNFATIFFIGAIVLGYKYFNEMNSRAEKVSGLNQPETKGVPAGSVVTP